MTNKIILSLAVIALISGYAIYNHNQSNQAVETIPSSSSDNSSNQTSSSSNGSANNMTYKDGTYTGSSADAFYGFIQVQATISGGKITNVSFLQYPSDRNESVQINSAAIPLLKSEAIQTQSAQVDIVSGATQSSEAFRQSLQSALSQAV